MDTLKINLPVSVRQYEPRNYQQARYLGNIADANQPIPQHHQIPEDIKDQ